MSRTASQKAPAQYYDRERFGDVSLSKTLILSIALHFFVIVLLPLISGLLMKPKPFERPQTFQLVNTIPLPPSPPRRVPTPPDPTPTPRPPEPVPPTPTPPIAEPPPPPPAPTPTPIPTPPPPPPREPEPEVRPDPPPPPPAPAPRQEQVKRVVEENLDDLAAMLTTLPAVQISAASSIDSRHHWYLNTVSNNVKRNWRPGTEDTRLAVEVNFIINRDGSVTSLTVSKSSGNSSLDRLGMRAVQTATFPPLPVGLGNQIEINITLRPTRS